MVDICLNATCDRRWPVTIFAVRKKIFLKTFVIRFLSKSIHGLIFNQTEKEIWRPDSSVLYAQQRALCLTGENAYRVQ